MESTISAIPSHTQVLIIGGGPAGSYAAAALAREGIQVVLLEAAEFPRYHVGESLIPSVRHYLRFIDAEQTLVEWGFKHKPGAAFKLDQSKREGYTDFVALGHTNSSWNVTRADFDKMLLDHAKGSGTRVYERTRVTSIRFSNDRPVSAEWTRSRSETGSPDHAAQGEISFDFVIDASGRAGLISDRHLKNRHYNESLRNIALWGYWTGVGTYGLGTGREGAPWFEALRDDSGWAWFIPLHDGTTSIGVVVNQKRYQDQWKETPGPSTLCKRYRALLALAPSLVQLIGTGTLVAKHAEGDPRGGADLVVRSAADFSYSAARYAGEGFRIVGDAGAFIDPLFSSGVHLAMTSALSAAASICASIRGDCSEAIAAAWHTRRFTLSYTRFQMVVLSAYKQIRATRFDVLCDVDEDGYERAFACIRPVIQGASDMGTRLSERELQNALDFCSKFFEPTDPEQRARALRSGLPGHLFDVSLAPVDPKELDVVLVGPCNEDQKASDGEGKDRLSLAETEVRSVRMVMEQANARRVVHREYLVNNLETEEIDGYVVRLREGSLGLSGVNGVMLV
ncbi:hypothetical protein JVU11DRAFT_8182 [Chiua virens]|nr:hypothetical protein JVU11DRAFT_8182 [Chiua virens]